MPLQRGRLLPLIVVLILFIITCLFWDVFLFLRILIFIFNYDSLNFWRSIRSIRIFLFDNFLDNFLFNDFLLLCCFISFYFLNIKLFHVCLRILSWYLLAHWMIHILSSSCQIYIWIWGYYNWGLLSFPRTTSIYLIMREFREI